MINKLFHFATALTNERHDDNVGFSKSRHHAEQYTFSHTAARKKT